MNQSRTAMRKIIVYNVVSLDGYHTGSGNDVSVMFPMMGIVVSDTLKGQWQDVRIIRRRDAYQQLAELKRQEGKAILITGSRTLWNDLLAHDLVDEIHLLIGNLVLGQGVPVFVGQNPTSLRLIDTRRWEDSDNVLLRYEVPHKSAEAPVH